MSNDTKAKRTTNRALWAVQVALALLFLFAGVMKLILPVEAMTAQIALPGAFLRFIGVAETFGALGLVLPGLVGIRTSLTPLAAAGLAIIMIGATSLSADVGGAAAAIMPFVVGALAATIGYIRWHVVPHRDRAVVDSRVLHSAH